MKVLIDLTSLADNFSGIERFSLSITKELEVILNIYSFSKMKYIKNLLQIRIMLKKSL